MSSRLGTLVLVSGSHSLIVGAERRESDHQPVLKLVHEPEVLADRYVTASAHALQPSEDDDQVITQRMKRRGGISNLAQHVLQFPEEGAKAIVPVICPLLDLSGKPWRELDLRVEDLGDQLRRRLQTAALVPTLRSRIPVANGVKVALTSGHVRASPRKRSKR
jgi:hypothetical protein